jgi:sarcosine oxidase subunit alpha
VEVLEEDLAWGGSLRALGGELPARPKGSGITREEGWRGLVESFRRAVLERKLALRTRTSAASLYGKDLLVASHAGVELVTPSTLVLATGAHDGVLAFEGNDTPGVLSARAAGRIAGMGIVVGESVVVVAAPGGGPFGQVFARASRGATLVHGTPVRVRGSSRVREVVVAVPEGERQMGCDAVVIDAPRAPAYELCAQAGAELAHGPAGYVVVTRGGRIGPGMFAVGEVAGTPLEPSAMLREAEVVASAA